MVKKAKALPQGRNIELIEVSKLEFDPQNPRFARYFQLEKQPTAVVIDRMVKVENVQELMGSIGEQGYFGGEPLLVAKSGRDLIVVEGNRRLAALKLLLGEIEPATKLPSIETLRAEAVEIPDAVECIVFDDRKDILRYLGYRHITGAKKWDSLSKARYLKQLKAEFYQGMKEDEQLRAIAKEIGSRKDYVAQMLASLNIFERAEAKNFYGLQRVKAEDVDFGVLTTALSYSNISDFVGLESRADMVGESINDDHVKDLLGWVFAQDQQGETILGESRNLRKLSAVVANDAATDRLRKEGSLEIAYLHTEGPSKALSNALNSAHKKLVAAFEMVPGVDSVEREHLHNAEKISDLADNVVSVLTRTLKKQRRGTEVDD